MGLSRSAEQTPLLADSRNMSTSECHYRQPSQNSGESRGSDDESSSKSSGSDPFDIEAGSSRSQSQGSVSTYGRIRTFLTEEIASDDWLKTQLLFLTFATGISDTTTLTTYRTFTSKQTGNTSTFALRVVNHPFQDEEEINFYFSFCFFLLGLFAFGQIGHRIKQRRRIFMLASGALQAALAWTAATLSWFITDKDIWPVGPVIMALLAFQHGGQITISIHLKQQELNTSMVTGALVQLMVDPNLFTWPMKNTARNKRILYIAVFFCGCILGAWITKHKSTHLALITYAIFKMVGCLTFLLNRTEEDRIDVDWGKPNGEPRDRPRSPLFRIIWGE